MIWVKNDNWLFFNLYQKICNRLFDGIESKAKIKFLIRIVWLNINAFISNKQKTILININYFIFPIPIQIRLCFALLCFFFDSFNFRLFTARRLFYSNIIRFSLLIFSCFLSIPFMCLFLMKRYKIWLYKA